MKEFAYRIAYRSLCKVERIMFVLNRNINKFRLVPLGKALFFCRDNMLAEKWKKEREKSKNNYS